MKVSIIGYGGRGSLYGDLFSQKNGIEIAAVCDIKQEQLDLAASHFSTAQPQMFLREEDFFAKPKLSDLMVVSTPDALHARHAIAALNAGYDLLLEKPIAANLEDCKEIFDTATLLNRRVYVCHVLRYAGFFAAIDRELKSGKYGKISTINLTENVAYWHQAHSYVRGNWRNSATSSPMIIAKSCHDLDLLCWFVGAECKGVSSMGSLNFFTAANAPKGSADRCLDCVVKDDCAYDAERFYFDKLAKGAEWPASAVVTNPTAERLAAALKDGPYGRCVFKCDNDVVDHQVVNMEFDGGITAHLTMTAFSTESYRQIHIHCEKGEIYGDMLGNKLHCNIFGKSSDIIDLNIDNDNSYGHGGGDYNMIKDIVGAYSGKPSVALTDIRQSMQSHFIGFAAEESRLNGGKLIKPLTTGIK